jgi:hypothetical protein
MVYSRDSRWSEHTPRLTRHGILALEPKGEKNRERWPEMNPAKDDSRRRTRLRAAEISTNPGCLAQKLSDQCQAPFPDPSSEICNSLPFAAFGGVPSACSP